MSIVLAASPESNFQLFKRVYDLYFKSLFHVFGLALFAALIIFLPRFISLALVSNNLTFSFNYIVFIVMEILLAFVFTALLWRIRCVITDAHEMILDDFHVALKKIGLIIIAAFIVFLIFVTFFLLMSLLFYYAQTHTSPLSFYIFAVFCAIYFLLSIYVSFLFSFYLPLILTEDMSPWGALKKSAKMVWGNWWRVFTLQVSVILIFFFTLVILKMFFYVDINFYFTSGTATFLATIINLVLLALFIPLYGSTLLVQLRDLELRKAL